MGEVAVDEGVAGEGDAVGRAGVGAGKGVGKGAGCVCASRVGPKNVPKIVPKFASTADGAGRSSMGEGTA